MKPDPANQQQESEQLEKDLLASRLRQVVSAMPGAPERGKILELLDRARWFCLSDSLVRDISDLIDQAPHEVEHNLDFMGYLGAPIWVEYANKKRLLREASEEAYPDAMGERQPVRIGFLMSGNSLQQEVPETLFSLVSWQFDDGTTHFSPATIYWDIAEVTQLAEVARFKLSRARNESIERMLEAVYVSTSPGLKEELSVMHDDPMGEEEAIHQAMRNSVSEAIFIAATFLYLSTPDVELEQRGSEEDEGRQITLVSPGPAKGTSFLGRVLGRNRGRLSRQKTRSGEILRWRNNCRVDQPVSR